MLFRSRDDRYGAQAKRLQFFTAAGIIDNVDGDVGDIFFRKKLFRSKTAASPRLGEENEFFAGIHARPVDLVSGIASGAYYPPRASVKQGGLLQRVAWRAMV